MWTYLDKLYSEGINLNRAYDVIQELFRSEQESRTLTQFYVDINKLSEEVNEIFFYQEMQERLNKLMVLVFLGALVQSFRRLN